jgi:hypothetical protein
MRFNELISWQLSRLTPLSSTTETAENSRSQGRSRVLVQIGTSSDAGLPLMFRRRLFSDHELQLGDEAHEPSSAN